MSNPDTFVEPRKRYTSEGPMFSIHFTADDSQRVYCCVTDKEYPARIAFAMLEEMQTKFLTKVRARDTSEGCLPNRTPVCTERSEILRLSRQILRAFRRPIPTAASLLRSTRSYRILRRCSRFLLHVSHANFDVLALTPSKRSKRVFAPDSSIAL